MRDKELTNLLSEPLSNKLDYCNSFGNEFSRMMFYWNVLDSICANYNDDPVNNTAIPILERALDERIRNHFSEEK